MIFNFFGIKKNCQTLMDSGFNSKTKIEKVFIDIMRNHRVIRIFVQIKKKTIRSEFFSSKYDLLGIKKSVIL